MTIIFLDLMSPGLLLWHSIDAYLLNYSQVKHAVLINNEQYVSLLTKHSDSLAGLLHRHV